MKLSKSMKDALNKQINEEIFSAYLYQAMAIDFTDKNLDGIANWFFVQAKEEMTHALKFQDYILQRGDRVELLPIKKPKSSWKNALEAFEDAYEHECYITSKIHKLLDMAKKGNDHATASMLQWFVDEQVEEEENTDDILQKIKLMKNAPGGLFMLDRELLSRKFVDETKGGD